jgi:hypothetical protein
MNEVSGIGVSERERETALHEEPDQLRVERGSKGR